MDLDAIEARANACLAGDWAIRENADYETEIVSAADDWCRIALLGGMPGETPAEAAFFVRAREDVRDLVTRVRELEEENARDDQIIRDLNATIMRHNARIAALKDENQRMRERLRAVSLIKAWTNEDGKGFVFTDDLLVALGHITPAVLSRAREIAEEKA